MLFLSQIWPDLWGTASILFIVVQSPLSGDLIDAHVTIKRYSVIANIQLVIVWGFFLLNIQMAYSYWIIQ